MNVSCPQCETVYRVDPSKVPERGVRARCATCTSVMTVAHPRVSPPSMVAETPAPAPESVAAVAQLDVVAPQPFETPVQEPYEFIPEVEPTIPADLPPPKPEPAIPETELAIPEPVIPELEPSAEAPEPEVTLPEAILPEPELEAVLPEPEPEPEPVTPEPEPEPQQAVPELETTEPAPEIRARYSRPFVQPREVTEVVDQAPAAPPRPTAPVFRPTPGMPVQAPTPTDAPEAPAAAERRRPVNPFLSRDPTQKARRLARALVSDMIVYQPKKRQDALEQGTLKQDFEEEIKKSWEEYVQQVGEELAESNDFFRDALNDILAGGRQVFEAGFKF